MPADLTAKRLSGLDLTGIDLSNAILRSARLNKTRLVDADGASSLRRAICHARPGIDMGRYGRAAATDFPFK